MCHRLLAVLLASVLAASAHAAFPNALPFQGQLKDGLGRPLPDGSYTVRFRLYTAPSGGTAIWTEDDSVAVSGGVFATVLGDGPSPVPGPAPFASGLYLGVTVGSDPEMTPRIRLLSAPTALVSAAVMANTVGPAELRSNGDSLLRVSGGLMGAVSGKVGIGSAATSPDALVHLGDGSVRFSRTGRKAVYEIATDPVGDYLYLDEFGVGRHFVLKPGGNVGLGTTGPNARLHIVGVDNDGTNAALRIDSGSQTMLLDGNEMDSNAGLFINNNSPSNIHLALGGGNVGVGSNSPSVKLEVTGESGIRVNTNTGVVRAKIGALAVLGGWMNLYGGNDLVNVSMGYLNPSYPNNGFVGVYNATGTQRAAMFVDGAGRGIIDGDIKSFRVPHPGQPGKDIVYVSLEGPEAGAYVRGTAHLVDGRALIALPEHFRAVAAESGMTVQVTPLSAESQGLAVVTKSVENGVEVRELRGGAGNYDFDYLVTCIRKGHEDHQVVQPSRAAPAAEPEHR